MGGPRAPEEERDMTIPQRSGFPDAESDYSDFATAVFLPSLRSPRSFAFLSLIPRDRISNRLGQLNGQTGAAPEQTVSPTA